MLVLTHFLIIAQAKASTMKRYLTETESRTAYKAISSCGEELNEKRMKGRKYTNNNKITINKY